MITRRVAQKTRPFGQPVENDGTEFLAVSLHGEREIVEHDRRGRTAHDRSYSA